MADKKDLNLVVTEDRMQDMDLKTFYGVDNSPKDMVDFIAHFMVGPDGNYMERKPAIADLTGGRKVADLEQIMEQLRESMEDGIVSPQ